MNDNDEQVIFDTSLTMVKVLQDFMDAANVADRFDSPLPYNSEYYEYVVAEIIGLINEYKDLENHLQGEQYYGGYLQ